MKHIFTISLCFLALSSSVYGQGCLEFGGEWQDPEPISVTSSVEFYNFDDVITTEIRIVVSSDDFSTPLFNLSLFLNGQIVESDLLSTNDFFIYYTEPDEYDSNGMWLGEVIYSFEEGGSNYPSQLYSYLNCGGNSFTVIHVPSEPTSCPTVELANSWITLNCGCTDSYACNYDPTAHFEFDSICDYVTCEGCTDIEADNYNPDATYDDGSCLFIGCMDNTACNYSPEATEDDGSCDYSCCPGPGCCDVGTYWNEETQTCIITNLTDTNLDGCTDLNDLMDILANYGDCAVSGFTCGNPLGYQGYDYETVLIGEQCWFSENCRYIPSVSPSSEGSDTEPYYYVYDYQGNNVGEAIATDNYETYGVLYNWPAVITDEICPSDWHVPSDGEFTQLTDFLGGANVAGDAMKSTTDWYNGGNGSNSSGFNGLPSGLAYSGSFSNDGYSADWWSSSSYFSSSARLLHLCYCNDIGHPSFDPRSYGFSARCLRD